MRGVQDMCLARMLYWHFCIFMSVVKNLLSLADWHIQNSSLHLDCSLIFGHKDLFVYYFCIYLLINGCVVTFSVRLAFSVGHHHVVREETAPINLWLLKTTSIYQKNLIIVKDKVLFIFTHSISFICPFFSTSISPNLDEVLGSKLPQ